MNKLDQIESRLQVLLEDLLIKSLPGFKPEDRVVQKLAEAMHSNLKRKKGSPPQAPNMYLIINHPGSMQRWHAEPKLLEELAQALNTAGTELGFQFAVRPRVTTAADTSLKPDEIRILASFSNESIADTQGISGSASDAASTDTLPSNAFLILQGTKIIPLTRTVINVGRRLDNHVVIDDPRVSRNHAQFRVIKGRFMVFDLNSTGGTYVNGQRTTQTVLYPGDVISLAGVTLIFGQDLPPGRFRDEPLASTSPQSGERPTAVLPSRKDKKK